MKPFAALGLFVCLFAPAFAGQAKKSKKSTPAAREAKAPRDDDDRHSFRDAEIRLIQDYYRAGGGHLPPGLSQKSKLPPGLEKQLKRSGKLPDGLEGHLEDFPEALGRQLPPPTEGCRRVVVGTTVVLLENSSKVVHDLFGVGR
jgi:hypothetical protein